MTVQLSLFKSYNADDLWLNSKRMVPLVKHRIKIVRNIAVSDSVKEFLFCLLAYHKLVFSREVSGIIYCRELDLNLYTQISKQENKRIRDCIAVNRKQHINSIIYIF